ncbi:DNA phosphorothioation-associated putative methyltransferase [Mesorhizobium sp.]|uniref:DNA phosphorothioation-associated putative methyltransferase n=1 Tax=Mesorhizobium sp. TaxID=1871066 RepID=UPI000FE5ED1B|nr:DNA phosphorothioation-associated putative methyltransferase [Mesorhizobium sp.]RWI63458.1 MAG: DNA phosphorothioation-associated putative methyltransferase [Mesorhizobium sp.]
MSDLTAPAQTIHRHRTAMVRHDLSQPVALLVRHGLIVPGVRVFDYGCGQGDDLRILGASGIEAAGWDPHFLPDAPQTPAAVVNLGFVLNVIEDPAERRKALTKAWALTERVLSVATMIVGQVAIGGLRPHGDGYLTSRGTFQKYFQHAELHTLITHSLGTNVVAVAPGIFFVFRLPEDEQEFLLNKRAGRRASTAAYRAPREPRLRPAVRPDLTERIPLALSEIAAFIRRRGRLPQADELHPHVLHELGTQSVSLARAVQVCLDRTISPKEVEAAAVFRQEDLLVHHALGLLNRSPSANRPSPAMMRDIRTHFGNQKELTVQATQYLHELADEDRVRAAMHKAAEVGLGVLDHRDRLIVDGERAEDLPGVLRCYFGCATFLSGDPDGPFLLRIDPGRRRVTMWPMPDLKAAFPVTEHSVRVDLRRQEVSVREDVRRLLRKSEVLGLSTRSRQRRVEVAYRVEHELPNNAVFEKVIPAPLSR